MARNDGVDRTSVRNLAVSDKAVGNTQQHNEREKDSYRNPDIIPQRAAWNVHFKKPTASYTDLFAQLETAGTISTRGLKPDATHYCELVFDVNSAYFDNHGGYEFAKQFYEDAYKAAVQIVGGEQYILSAVMHADEINRAMTEALGREVYHYHLHVVYVPVVEKQILWSKRCKDKALVGTVKETVIQVSRSKKWASKPLLDDAGKPVLQKNGKPVLKKSYSILQDDFFNYMRSAGYTDVERGERGSTEEHLMIAHQWLVKLDMFFREEMMRVAYRCFPNFQNLVIVLRGRLAYIRKIVTQMVEYIPVVSQFRLMQHTFIDKSVPFKHLL